ncbi:hypothetical protein BIU82_04020 [Arthrobacter sp. SW1]|uniref:GNAT family N-acetyltransferase n=1 Tax=Arthrobacter sp. SW1 TaxID=1920889 RepID=UPI000877DC2F|nr:GNAT family N-acetyltransferase [Arthrobacter sp. SW1]OFI38497.1 hypothetical protein BIU82_04020 [Arthrobacter sp. SW1]
MQTPDDGGPRPVPESPLRNSPQRAAAELAAPLLSSRLRLRLLESGDTAVVHQLRSHPDATRYLSHSPFSAEQSEAWLQEQLQRSAASTPEHFNLSWAITLRDSGALIGNIRAWNTSEPPAPGPLASGCASLGYVLHPDHHGLGYGREAAAAMVEWLFTERNARTVFAGVYEPNLPSRRLLEGLGFTVDRHFSAAQDRHGKGLPSLRYRLDRIG